jgi:hypothetical protein
MTKVTTDDLCSMLSELKACLLSGKVHKEKIEKWKSITHNTLNNLNNISNNIELLEERYKAEIAILKEEMRDELVSREAISARTSNRFRLLAEQNPESCFSVFEKALNTASSIEACISSLSIHTFSVNQGTIQLDEQMQIDTT